MYDAELLERRIGDCACPEEEYLFGGINLIVHYEPNGDVDGFMDGGDWGEAEFTAKGLGHVAGRAAVFAWADTLTG